MVDIAYLTLSRLPGTAANAVQVMKMAQALLHRDPALLMTAVSTGADVPSAAQLASLYGVEHVPLVGRTAADVSPLKLGRVLESGERHGKGSGGIGRPCGGRLGM